MADGDVEADVAELDGRDLGVPCDHAGGAETGDVVAPRQIINRRPHAQQK
jgi:hypothetical protein